MSYENISLLEDLIESGPVYKKGSEHAGNIYYFLMTAEGYHGNIVSPDGTVLITPASSQSRSAEGYNGDHSITTVTNEEIDLELLELEEENRKEQEQWKAERRKQLSDYFPVTVDVVKTLKIIKQMDKDDLNELYNSFSFALGKTINMSEEQISRLNEISSPLLELAIYVGQDLRLSKPIIYKIVTNLAEGKYRKTNSVEVIMAMYCCMMTLKDYNGNVIAPDGTILVTPG